MLAEGCGHEKGFLMPTQHTAYASNETAKVLKVEEKQWLLTERMFFIVITKTLYAISQSQ